MMWFLQFPADPVVIKRYKFRSVHYFFTSISSVEIMSVVEFIHCCIKRRKFATYISSLDTVRIHRLGRAGKRVSKGFTVHEILI